ncbi:hypothetical protein FKG94_00960 [Exilibacterium tricleocarpae]|uniref:DUF6265 domain-containing protein n=1 Tax=Exilibacterium tricleocarpae TaxID=2591008 RepID=A0A545U9K0_9GAMM|nr:DUF6265 family protein [Exilibacterium tricleocarpae]TQV86154.1 hypothetical protein FKG94_00960 [Exilibacterium tricleocarpae]
MARCALWGICIILMSSASATELEKLSFLSGCWQGNMGESGSIRETFTRPRGDTILGNSQIVIDNKNRFVEFIRIYKDQSGVNYRPYPDGKEAANFKMVKLGDKEVVFENMENDYPKIISYRYQSDGMLNARIEGANKEKVQNFYMAPVDCGAETHLKALRSKKLK